MDDVGVGALLGAVPPCRALPRPHRLVVRRHARFGVQARLLALALTSAAAAAVCSDSSSDCPKWAAAGQCDANPAYMMMSCKASCHRCGHLRQHYRHQPQHQGASDGGSGGGSIPAFPVPWSDGTPLSDRGLGVPSGALRRGLVVKGWVLPHSPDGGHRGERSCAAGSRRAIGGLRVGVQFKVWLCKPLMPGARCQLGPVVSDTGLVPFRFKVGAAGVVRGLSAGCVGMCEGETRVLIVPAALGYGRKQTDGVPVGSTLRFIVTMRHVYA
jgi:FKBP-type peptidyl-prolyl cis-trans isomerase FkpA